MDPVTMAIGGTVLSAGSAIMGGKAAKEAADYEAQQMDAQGDSQMAAASLKAFETAKQGDILLSNQRAAQAGSGGTTSDAGAVEQHSELSRKIQCNTLSEVFAGERRRASLRKGANAKRIEGRNAQKSSYAKAASTVISGASNAYSLSSSQKAASLGNNKY